MRISTQPKLVHTTRDNQKTSKGSASQSVNFVRNNRTAHPQVKTTEKTVHLKEMKQLEKSITSSIDNITQDIKKNHKNGLGSLFTQTSPAKMSAQLEKLNQTIQIYQTKLDSSSYKHHASKQTTLDRLKNDINETQMKIDNESKEQDNIKSYSKTEPKVLSGSVETRRQKTKDFADDGY